MKMYKMLLVVLMATLLSACGEELSCGSSDVTDLFKEKLRTELRTPLENTLHDKTKIDERLNQALSMLSMEGVVTTDQNKEIGFFECEAEFVVTSPEGRTSVEMPYTLRMVESADADFELQWPRTDLNTIALNIWTAAKATIIAEERANIPDLSEEEAIRLVTSGKGFPEGMIYQRHDLNGDGYKDFVYMRSTYHPTAQYDSSGYFLGQAPAGWETWVGVAYIALDDENNWVFRDTYPDGLRRGPKPLEMLYDSSSQNVKVAFEGGGSITLVRINTGELKLTQDASGARLTGPEYKGTEDASYVQVASQEPLSDVEEGIVTSDMLREQEELQEGEFLKNPEDVAATDHRWDSQ